jgi:hypothetical protein
VPRERTRVDRQGNLARVARVSAGAFDDDPGEVFARRGVRSSAAASRSRCASVRYAATTPTVCFLFAR